MPVVSLTLEDENRTILSQAYYKIIRDIISATKIPHGTLVAVHKDIEVTLTDNKNNVSGIPTENLPTTVANRRIMAVINENYNEDEVTTTAVNQTAAYPIFIDNDVDVRVYPVYVKSDIEIEFSYISPSKAEATRIRNDLRLRLSQMRNITIHEVDYTIILPEIVEEFITDVYDLKNRLIPQAIDDYIREHTTKRLHPVTDMANSENVRLGIYERQVRIVGSFDILMPEKIEAEHEDSTYKVGFVYKLSMDVPRAIAMRYPVMIANRPMPSKYIKFIEDHKRNSLEERKKVLNYTSNSLYNLSHFESHRQLENRVDIALPINVPMFDDFNVRQGNKRYAILVSFLLQVDETDKRTLFNLSDLSPYAIPQNLLDYIRDVESPYIVRGGASFLFLGLHQTNRFYDSEKLVVMPDLTVKSTVDLDLMVPTRVTIGICVDIAGLEKSAVKRLREYPPIMCLFVNEHINAVNAYKTELQNVRDDSFFGMVFEVLMYYLDVEWYGAVNCILTAIGKDKFYGDRLCRLLLGTELYRRLLKLGILVIDPAKMKPVIIYGDKNPLEPPFDNFNELIRNIAANTGRTGEPISQHVMKTVMSTYVVLGHGQPTS